MSSWKILSLLPIDKSRNPTIAGPPGWAAQGLFGPRTCFSLGHFFPSYPDPLGQVLFSTCFPLWPDVDPLLKCQPQVMKTVWFPRGGDRPACPFAIMIITWAAVMRHQRNGLLPFRVSVLFLLREESQCRDKLCLSFHQILKQGKWKSSFPFATFSYFFHGDVR